MLMCVAFKAKAEEEEGVEVRSPMDVVFLTTAESKVFTGPTTTSSFSFFNNSFSESTTFSTSPPEPEPEPETEEDDLAAI